MASAASSTLSQVTSRGSSNGVPTRCWCGEKVVVFVSKTSYNPYRRFYRCEIALKRKHEHHLFTWVDEALLEEIRMVDFNHQKLVEDVNDLRKNVMERMEFEKMEERVMSNVMEKMENELSMAKVEITWSTVKRVCGFVVILALFVLLYQVMA